MLRFAKGGGTQKSPVRTPDNIVTTDTVELLLGLCEGPIKGLVNGPKTFYVANTALIATDGKPNFSSFALQFYPGVETGHTVTMDLGGFSSPINIGTTLAENTSVTRSGDTTGIDAADFRIVIQSLYKQNDDGIFTTPLSLKFEVKKSTDLNWQPAWTSDAAPPIPPTDPGDGTDKLWQNYGLGADQWHYEFDGMRPVFVYDVPPTQPPAVDNTLVITSADGTLWSWGGTDWVQQPLTPGGDNYETMGDGARLYHGTETPTDARQGDLWYGVDFFRIYNGTSWVATSFNTANGVTMIPPDGIWNVDGKVTSPTAKDLRVFLPKDANATWDFRVTKLSQDSDTLVSSVVSWESIQEIKRTPWHFDAVSMVRVVGQASDQFTSLPAFTGDYDLRIIRVPSNYDPDTRTYTGIWDGTWKLACSSNPAYVFMDFVENDRYGLSSLYPHTCNKWNIYDWGVYCDQLVTNGDGSTRPRWTFNDIFLDPRDAKELAQYIAGAAGARMVDDGNGIVDVIVDMDSEAVAIFTPENVGEDGFSYSYTDRLTRSNEIIVEFVNPNLDWQADKRRVTDDDDIATFGRISENFVAVACTDENEALARARRRLIGGLTEKEFVTFTVNRKGTFLSEWDIILVADPDMGRGVTGRIRSQLDDHNVSLRDPVTFETGVTYYCTFTIPNPDYPDNSTAPMKTVKFTITNAAGSTNQLTFAESLPTLPEYAAFGIEAEGYVGIPKPYRILNLDDQTGEGEVIRVTALELNRNKYAFIDNGTPTTPIDYGTTRGPITPPTNLQFQVSVQQRGLQSVRVGSLTWDKSDNRYVREYAISHTVDGVDVPAPAATSNTFCEFDGLKDGVHVFAVKARDIFGRESSPAIYRWDSSGVTPVTGQFNFRLAGDGDTTTFDTTDVTVVWDNVTTSIPHFSHWEFLVIGDTLSLPIRIENAGQALTWTYKLEKNRADHGGVAPRQLQMGLRAVDSAGNSSAPDVITITNTAPPAPRNVSVQFDADALLVQWDPPDPVLPDFGGTKVFSDTTADPTTLVYDGTGNQCRIPLTSAATYYVKVGQYDLYDPTEVTFAITLSQGVTELFSDTIAEAKDVIGQVDQLAADAEQTALNLILDRLAAINEVRTREVSGASLESKTTELQDDQSATAQQLNTFTAETNDNFAQVNTELTATSNLTNATASSLATLGAVNDLGDAFVIDMTKAYIDQATSLSARLSLIESRFGGTSSSYLLTQVNTANTNASAAITSIGLMGARNGSNTGFILNTSKVFIGVDGQSLAQYIQGLSVSSAQASAIADSRISVQLGPGGSIASAISTVQSTANSAQASATLALNTANGDTASIAALTWVSGRLTGVKINGAAASIIVQADKFMIVDASGAGAVVPFSVINGFANFANPVTVQKVGANYQLIIGPGFGAQGDLVLWYGPQSVAVGSATVSNSVFSLDTNGQVKYPAQGSSVFQVSVDHPGCSFSSATGSSVTNPTTNNNNPTVSVTGNVGPVTYQWNVGDPNVSASIPSGASTGFTYNGTILVGDKKGGNGVCTITDTGTGQQRQIIVSYRFLVN